MESIHNGQLISKCLLGMGAFNTYMDKMRGEGVKICLGIFVHAQGIKTDQAGRGAKNGKILSM